MDRLPNMSEVAALYETRHTIFTLDGSARQMVLEADPRRFYVRFSILNAIGITYPLLPGPTINSVFPPIAANIEWEVKFKDCPSICTGEWYCGGGAGGAILITECVFTQ